MNPKPNRNKTIALIYLACALICAVRAVISLLSHGTGVFVTRLILAVIFAFFFLRYRRIS